MTWVTSRGFVLPDTEDGLANNPWFNLWSKKYWPYEKLEPSDVLLIYESPSKAIVWRSRVVEVLRFSYKAKEEVKKKLQLSEVEITRPYFVEGPESGYCLHYKVQAIERMRLLKPDAFRFPQLGWLKVDREVGEQWPGLTSDS